MDGVPLRQELVKAEGKEGATGLRVLGVGTVQEHLLDRGVAGVAGLAGDVGQARCGVLEDALRSGAQQGAGRVGSQAEGRLHPRRQR